MDRRASDFGEIRDKVADLSEVSVSPQHPGPIHATSCPEATSQALQDSPFLGIRQAARGKAAPVSRRTSTSFVNWPRVENSTATSNRFHLVAHFWQRVKHPISGKQTVLQQYRSVTIRPGGRLSANRPVLATTVPSSNTIESRH
jgi:hypothetical protein